MHRPRTVNVWEARSALRWGSKHEKWFKTEEAAVAFANKRIADTGGVGRITLIDRAAPGGIVYFNEYEDDV